MKCESILFTYLWERERERERESGRDSGGDTVMAVLSIVQHIFQISALAAAGFEKGFSFTLLDYATH